MSEAVLPPPKLFITQYCESYVSSIPVGRVLGDRFNLDTTMVSVPVFEVTSIEMPVPAKS